MIYGRSHEQLERRLCPKGCGQQVLVGEDGTAFETEGRYVLQNPQPLGRGGPPYSGFVQPDGFTRVVQRARLWFEHDCPPKPAVTPSVEDAVGRVVPDGRDAAPAPREQDADANTARAGDGQGVDDIRSSCG